MAPVSSGVVSPVTAMRTWAAGVFVPTKTPTDPREGSAWPSNWPPRTRIVVTVVTHTAKRFIAALPRMLGISPIRHIPMPHHPRFAPPGSSLDAHTTDPWGTGLTQRGTFYPNWGHGEGCINPRGTCLCPLFITLAAVLGYKSSIQPFTCHFFESKKRGTSCISQIAPRAINGRERAPGAWWGGQGADHHHSSRTAEEQHERADGAAYQNRTDDLLITSEMLYRLS